MVSTSASRSTFRRQARRSYQRHDRRPGLERRDQPGAVVRSTTRETAYSRAFREIFKFIAGREPERLKIIPQPKVRLSGPVTGTPGGVQNNRPVAGAAVEVFRVAPDSGEWIGAAIHTSKTAADGRWGPAEVDPRLAARNRG